MTFRAVQPNFSKGEIASHLYGRFDVDAWQAGTKQACNVLVMKYGGLTKRPGTVLVGRVLNDTQEAILLPFTFSLEQTYALEFGHGYMSPCAGGGRVVQEELAITGVSLATQASVTIAYHGFAVGDYIYITGVAGAIGDLLNGRTWTIVSVSGTNTFEIDANTTGLAAFTTSTGGITRGAPPTPDPTPPTIPAPYVPPADPDVWGGGAWDWAFRYNPGW